MAASRVTWGSMVMTLLPLRDSIVLTFMGRLPSPEVSRSLGAPSRISNVDIGREFRRVTDLTDLRNRSSAPGALQIQRPIGYVTEHPDDRTKLRRTQERKFLKTLPARSWRPRRRSIGHRGRARFQTSAWPGQDRMPQRPEYRRQIRRYGPARQRSPRVPAS